MGDSTGSDKHQGAKVLQADGRRNVGAFIGSKPGTDFWYDFQLLYVQCAVLSQRTLYPLAHHTAERK